MIDLGEQLNHPGCNFLPAAVAVGVVAGASIDVVLVIRLRDVCVGPVVVGVFVVFQEHRGVEQDLADRTTAIEKELKEANFWFNK